MRFTYRYKTPDGIEHSGEVAASGKEVAYTALKRQGIRPFGVVPSPGFLNRILGLSKLWLVIVLLGGVAFALLLALRREVTAMRPDEATSRHQIYGDPAVLEEFESDGFASVFDDPLDRYLAHFAIPGKVTTVSATSVRDYDPRQPHAPVPVGADDPRELRELKQIVNGMRLEMRGYLAEGGTYSEFLRDLSARQNEEEQIYNRVKNELEADPDPVLFKERNDQLRAMGLRTIPRPKKK